MPSNSVRLKALIVDLGALALGWGAAQVVFAGYEAHVPWRKRLAKLGGVAVAFAGIHAWGGRRRFYGALGLMLGAIGILHGYWFHHRHGIHWRTAEPRDRYLDLIGQSQPPAP